VNGKEVIDYCIMGWLVIGWGWLILACNWPNARRFIRIWCDLCYIYHFDMKPYALTIKTIVIHSAPWQVTPPYNTTRHSAAAAAVNLIGWRDGRTSYTTHAGGHNHFRKTWKIQSTIFIKCDHPKLYKVSKVVKVHPLNFFKSKQSDVSAVSRRY